MKSSRILSQSFVWIGSATHSTSDAFRQRQRERIRIATLARENVKKEPPPEHWHSWAGNGKAGEMVCTVCGKVVKGIRPIAEQIAEAQKVNAADGTSNASGAKRSPKIGIDHPTGRRLADVPFASPFNDATPSVNTPPKGTGDANRADGSASPFARKEGK